MTTQETIKALQTPFPPDEVKWKVQATKGTWSTYVAYVDSRAVAKKLDDATSLMWQDRYEEVSGLLICSIGLFIDGQWIWRSDTGTESDMDKEKGHVSDAFKRCAVKFGVGRDLYDMPIIKIKNTGSNQGKPFATYKGKQIYDATSVCRELIQASNSSKQIWWDDEKQNLPTQKPTSPPPSNKGTDKWEDIFRLLTRGSNSQKQTLAKMLSSSQCNEIIGDATGDWESDSGVDVIKAVGLFLKLTVGQPLNRYALAVAMSFCKDEAIVDASIKSLNEGKKSGKDALVYFTNLKD